MKWFIKCIKNYANFTGRAHRSEYWYFVLFVFLFAVAARVLDLILFADKPIGVMLSPISGVLGLFFILPQMAVMVRRLHDIDRSGKWVLWYYILAIVWVIALVVTGVSAFAGAMTGSLPSMSVGFLITLIGGGLAIFAFAITLFVWFCMPGDEGDNKYGPAPKAVEE